MNFIDDIAKDVSFDNAEEQAEIHELMCKCGHKFYMHAFVLAYDYNLQHNYYRTSQCTSCGYDYETERFDCEKFEEKR